MQCDELVQVFDRVPQRLAFKEAEYSLSQMRPRSLGDDPRSPEVSVKESVFPRVPTEAQTLVFLARGDVDAGDTLLEVSF